MKQVRIFAICVLHLLAYAAFSQTNTKDWQSLKVDNFYLINSPLDYLEILRNDFNTSASQRPYQINSAPVEWIKAEHIPFLMKLVHSTDSTRSIMSSVSSHYPAGKFSTIGHEAQNLIEAFRLKKSYPMDLNSFGLPNAIRARELKEWWHDIKNFKKVFNTISNA